MSHLFASGAFWDVADGRLLSGPRHFFLFQSMSFFSGAGIFFQWSRGVIQLGSRRGQSSLSPHEEETLSSLFAVAALAENVPRGPGYSGKRFPLANVIISGVKNWVFFLPAPPGPRKPRFFLTRDGHNPSLCGVRRAFFSSRRLGAVALFSTRMCAPAQPRQSPRPCYQPHCPLCAGASGTGEAFWFPA